jgi:2-iminobutanoate/2-iminopropanoate deaminase
MMHNKQITLSALRGNEKNVTIKTTNRRAMLTGVAAVAVAGAGLSGAADTTVQKKVYRSGPKPATPPPFSAAVSLGNLLFISGVVCRTPGDIKAHTDFVLGDLKRQLEAAGSSMEKVLRCTVFLADLKDFAAMNEIYTGKFGDEPPARTTVAVAGITANSLLEVDAIAYI